MGLFKVLDVGVDFMNEVDADVKAEREAEKLKIDETCVKCKDKFGKVDLEWMADAAGVTEQKVIVALRGSAIFQDPTIFEDRDEWDALVGWKFAEQYLCGNISDKLKLAQKMEERFPKCFESNVEALKRLLPKKVPFNSIHASLGASWIPIEIYEVFLQDLFKQGLVKVHYVSELSKYKIIPNCYVVNSIANKVTYGTDRMSAIDIIQKTMNASSVKVYDYDSRHNFYDQRVFNKKQTLAAQEKQNLILQKWSEWLRNRPAVRRRIEECYNDQFVGYSHSPFDGSFLTFSDLNPDITLYKHQKDAIARALLSSNNLLLAHEVGSGKTYEMIAIAHELKRMGLSDKNMIVFPNNVLGDAVNTHKLLYPNDKILSVFPKDFTPKNRNKILEEIRNNDYVAVYMAYSSFDMITMSKDWWINQKHSEIQRLKNVIANSTDSIEKNMLKSKEKRAKKSLEKYMLNANDTPWLSFNELGINTLIVDEAHNYKNISLETRTDSIVGMHTKGSKKCNEMLAKCHSVDKLIFSTGTPLTNSLADLYTMQKYLQPKELEFHNLAAFDMWINTFAEREEDYEIDIDSSSLRSMVRFSRFHNLTELMSLFSTVCDFHFNDNAEGLPKCKGYIDITCKRNPIQAKYIKDIVERTELCRTGKVSRMEDNLLKICTDGRKAALDDRLVVANAVNYYYTTRKVAKCAEQIKNFYDEYPDTSQVVFSDIGTPKYDFNIYDALRDELELLGIPPHEIAYVHDATTEKKREKLFKDVNEGLIRVIIGSTSKLGIGTNIQERLVAAHHLSVPWKPAEIIQREGRIIRNFNNCDDVFIFRYITPDSFDSFSWQILENKQKFISSFLSGASNVRDADDIGEAVLNYAEIKAVCIGNPLVKKRVETANRIERVKILSAQKQSQLLEAANIIAETPDKLDELVKCRDIVRKDIKLYKRNKERIPNDERIAFGEELLEALKDNNIVDTERLFSAYQGFDIILPANMLVEKPYIYIKSKHHGVYYNDVTDITTALGYSKSIDYLLDHLNDRLKNITLDIHNLKKNCEMAKADYEAGNSYDEELQVLYKELEVIDKEIEKEKEKNDVA